MFMTAVVSAAITGSVGNAAAQGAKVDEKDAQAQSLGYKQDATEDSSLSCCSTFARGRVD